MPHIYPKLKVGIPVTQLCSLYEQCVDVAIQRLYQSNDQAKV